jgi:hypothetical protein
MLLVRFIFAGSIWWRLNSDDPLLFALPKTGEWSLVNPLLYGALPCFGRRAADDISQVDAGKMFGSTRDIVFASKDNRRFPKEKELRDQLQDNLKKIAEDFLLRLRHVGAQATMPKIESLGAWTFSEIPQLPVYVPPPPTVLSLSMVQKYLWSSAITAKRICSAVALGPDVEPPTHEVILLDAFAAYRADDDRSAILYAAISAETVFGFVIGKEYKRLKSSHDDERFRFIQLTQAGAVLVHKDPVYERLSRGSRLDFHVLIHELALYVLRRSLLVENELLYKNAKRLHSTRNKIVHSSELGDKGSGDPFPIDKIGSITALETAVALFSWLGERSDYTLPNHEFEKHSSLKDGRTVDSELWIE